MPGHWEGDLIIGKDGKSAVITLAELSSRFCLINALPEGRTRTRPTIVILVTVIHFAALVVMT